MLALRVAVVCRKVAYVRLVRKAISVYFRCVYKCILAVALWIGGGDEIFLASKNISMCAHGWCAYRWSISVGYYIYFTVIVL